jgi:hypothetical protein
VLTEHDLTGQAVKAVLPPIKLTPITGKGTAGEAEKHCIIPKTAFVPTPPTPTLEISMLIAQPLVL